MKLIFLVLFLIQIQLSTAQTLYFPPLAGDTWETTDPITLGWCPEYLNDLYDFLDAEESKAFIVLKDGKIVLEKYFDRFTKDSLWYWASAGKVLTSFLVGIAQQEGKLNIHDLSSKYLGTGWTNTNIEVENKITIWHQLTMTSGLDDGVADNHCIKPECLVYKADAGNRWAYHNAPYTLLRDVLEKAYGLNENQLIQSKIKSRIGMNGLWLTLDYDNVYFSNARSMARFGLLVQNQGVWKNDSILKDQKYFNDMISPSQLINKSYGFLWWLNGKSSFMLPGLQLVIPGPLIPEAPKDMISAVGKNGQLLCIVPSLGLVVLRMGESNGNDEVPILLANQMWMRLNKVICTGTGSKDFRQEEDFFQLYPNPSCSLLKINTYNNNIIYNILIYNFIGKFIGTYNSNEPIDVTFLPPGIYFVHIPLKDKVFTKSFVKN